MGKPPRLPLTPEEREAFEQAKQRAKDLFRDHFYTVEPKEVENLSDNGEES